MIIGMMDMIRSVSFQEYIILMIMRDMMEKMLLNNTERYSLMELLNSSTDLFNWIRSPSKFELLSNQLKRLASKESKSFFLHLICCLSPRYVKSVVSSQPRSIVPRPINMIPKHGQETALIKLLGVVYPPFWNFVKCLNSLLIMIVLAISVAAHIALKTKAGINSQRSDFWKKWNGFLVTRFSSSSSVPVFLEILLSIMWLVIISSSLDTISDLIVSSGVLEFVGDFPDS